MRFEEQVRQRHQQQEAVGHFFVFLDCFKNDELELAQGRLADLLSAGIKEDALVRGVLLTEYAERRKRGERRFSRIQRLKQGGKVERAALRENFRLEEGVTIREDTFWHPLFVGSLPAGRAMDLRRQFDQFASKMKSSFNWASEKWIVGATCIPLRADFLRLTPEQILALT